KFASRFLIQCFFLFFPFTKELARVRVFVRVRPKNDEDLLSGGDSFECVELQPELKRLKLRKNNWNSESYKFDEVFTESATQKRVYEVVAKPVVESVLNGYNGTVMAYGQTGTGKTYTVGQLGKEDPSECGIMVRAMKDILANTSPGSFTVEISYLQLYLESVQDLLLPEKNNIPIVEDPKTGEVSLPGSVVIKVQDLYHFVQLLQIGEANRHAANTKLNTESSRSHTILTVYIHKNSQGKAGSEPSSLARDTKIGVPVQNGVATILKSKLLIVDLAGSERIDKSGSEGHMLEEAKFINLSLTSLGKCINALAENSPHIPTRDSKLTRLLRDSFGGYLYCASLSSRHLTVHDLGHSCCHKDWTYEKATLGVPQVSEIGSARTSLMITIGPSARNYAETASTVMFGQRAMKVVNMVKLKEEFDYESLCRKLECQVDYLTAELERQQKSREDDREEMEKKLRDCRNSFAELEKDLVSRSEFLENENSHLQLEIRSTFDELKLQKDHNDLLNDEVARLEVTLEESKENHLENSTYQKVLADTTQMYEKKITELIEELEDEHACFGIAQEELHVVKKVLSDYQTSFPVGEMKIHGQNEIDELRLKLREICELYKKTVQEFQSLKTENEELMFQKIQEQNEVAELRMKVQESFQLHEKTLKELQHMSRKNEDLISEQIQGENEIKKLTVKLQEMSNLHEKTVNELQSLQAGQKTLLSEKAMLDEELCKTKQRMSVEEKQRKYLEDENAKLIKLVDENDGDSECKKQHLNGITGEISSGFGTPMSLLKLHQPRESISGQKATVAKIYDEVGLPKIISMLSSEELEVQTHAVKVVANLAAE
ncbi:hypothetical protein IFM89_010671, partial [Coptis chinensis]